MVGTGAAGASPSGLRFCTSIPPGRTSHSSSLAAAAAAGGGGAEFSFIAAAAGGNVPFALARIIFSWHAHAHAHATNLPKPTAPAAKARKLPLPLPARQEPPASSSKQAHSAAGDGELGKGVADLGRESRRSSERVCVQVLDAGLNWGNQDQAAER
uniref:Uncharacterized protein n=1 Tax=Oryza meridionalis TaxID=40149 RepID=A0A0E0EU00_9ORYZ